MILQFNPYIEYPVQINLNLDVVGPLFKNNNLTLSTNERTAQLRFYSRKNIWKYWIPVDTHVTLSHVRRKELTLQYNWEEVLPGHLPTIKQQLEEKKSVIVLYVNESQLTEKIPSKRF
jgi:hypothetical protein